MSLFDVIRYSISIPPTVEELAALPDALYNVWIRHPTNSWHGVDTESIDDRKWVSSWMYRNFNSEAQEKIMRDIKLLRKLILEYEE